MIQLIEQEASRRVRRASTEPEETVVQYALTSLVAALIGGVLAAFIGRALGFGWIGVVLMTVAGLVVVGAATALWLMVTVPVPRLPTEDEIVMGQVSDRC